MLWHIILRSSSAQAWTLARPGRHPLASRCDSTQGLRWPGLMMFFALPNHPNLHVLLILYAQHSSIFSGVLYSGYLPTYYFVRDSRNSPIHSCITICRAFHGFYGSLLGIPYHTIPVGSGQGDPARPAIVENLLNRPRSTRPVSDISNTS